MGSREESSTISVMRPAAPVAARRVPAEVFPPVYRVFRGVGVPHPLC